jgi:alkanesulfonate monooxygenase SsuD/methylene tetrahydromethanopterin reductase-like flavin-dependent oxidoreductase (luciferase family)
VDARFLQESTVADLGAAVRRAAADGVSAVFLTSGPLGDAITLAAGLCAAAPTLLFGIRTNLSTEPHRHPTVLAREMTAFDLVSGGRSLLAFTPPFSDADAVAEAMALCRAMWRDGVAASEGPVYPVAGAVNRPKPRQDGGPPLALDLTDGMPTDRQLMELADLLLLPPSAAATATPDPALPRGVEVCTVHGA